MKISIYSNLTDEELEALHIQLTEKYGRDLQDDSKPSEERKLVKLVERKASSDKQVEEIAGVCEFAKEHVYRKLKELAFIEYQVMDKQKDFGIYGELRVSMSFCRNILSIPNDREVTIFDDDRFRRILKECDKSHGNKSVEDYQAYIKNFTLELFEKKYLNVNLDEINKLFDLLNVNYYFYVTTTNFIFGIIEKSLIGDKYIITFQKEYIRSPNDILSIAAFARKDGMIIREEACEVIFFNKWQRFHYQLKSERNCALRHIDSAIRDGIIEHTLFLYKAINTTDVLQIKKIFMQNMRDGIIWHEVGHFISNTEIDLDHTRSAFRGKLNNDSKAGHVLLEILADYAPIRDQKKGAFARFAELAKTDIVQATRNLYSYMSDNYFLDENEEDFMCLMTNVLIALSMYFINPDGSVDFIRIANEYEKVYELALKRFRILCDNMLAVIRHSRYEINTRQLDFYDLAKEILEIAQNPQHEKADNQFDYSHFQNKIENEFKHNDDISLLEKLPTLETYWSFWTLMEKYLEKYSKTGWEQYENVQREEAVELERLIFSEIIKKDGAKYENSLHNYIVERAKEIGIIETLPEIDTEAVLNKIRRRRETHINNVAINY